ncbi:hypothetical protein MOV61_28685, partial [Neorhizobium sp. BETTINA12A]|uniref:RHS repeat domain-containing protein n=1 Tax=Neorhizobium sp. BETTINA12A TaxID=2908924 RepID=UPI002867EB5F
GSGAEALEPGTRTGAGAGASSNDRAVDRTLGLGKPQGNGLGGSDGKAAGVEDQTDKAGISVPGTALGKPAVKLGEDTQSGTADASGKDADGALEPQAMSAMAAAAGSAGGGSSLNAPEKASMPEITGNGFFTQKIGIEVPGFRGLEPKLSLNYSSSRKTRLGGLYQGWLGYAWGVDGFDVIERATPGYGYPFFDGNDVYLLNGEELVRCATGMVAASCSAGGTHVTENENFKRVIFDATANTWTVTDRDGTVSLFKSVMAIAGSTPASGTPDYQLQHDGRFLLSSVTDTNGNAVNYAYTCPDLPVCYPSVVSYGGMSVNFHYEARPDYLVMANGLGLSYTKQRIRTIAVKVGGELRSAYTLTYDQAPFSNASRLTKVDRYGDDATVSAAGVVTGTTFKTIRQMTYDNANFNYAPQQVSQLIGTYPTGTFVGGVNLDVDFDGQDESFQIYQETLCEGCGDGNDPSTGGGIRYHLAFTKLLGPNLTTQSVLTSTLPALTQVYGNTPGSLRWFAGRHTAANGKDIVIASSSSTFEGPEIVTRWQDFVYKVGPNWTLTLEGCATPPFVTACSTAPHEAPSLAGLVSLDFDGDGVDNIAYVGGDTPSSVGDFAANGRQSLFLVHPSALVLRNVDGAWIGAPAGPNCGTPFICRLGDLNGDGTTDIVFWNGSNSQMWLSTGTGFVLSGGFSLNNESSLRDFDNDGKFEFTHDRIAVSGIGFGAAGIQHLVSNYVIPQGYWAAGDFNGDGLPEVSGDITFMSQPGDGNPNLLRTVKLETGGTVGVDYTPSTRWSNVFMPQVLHAVTRLRVYDGRGQVAATDYAYAGGLYDPKARKFWGYKTITVTKPLANGETARPVVETTYRQDLASYGLPEKTVTRNSANTASKTVAETYVVNAATKPYKALNTASETTLTEAGTSLILRKERIFDAYGNISEIRDFGRKDLAGDETWTLASYTPNTAAYIVSLPRARNIRSGGFSTSTDVFEQHQTLYYDGSTDITAPPTKGNLTMLGSFKSFEPTQASYNELFTYDAYGNRLSHVDGEGSRTEWDYDPDYHLHVVAERAPKYFATGGQPADARFVSTFTNDYVCGKPARKIDWNGVTETFTYDPFCRPYGYTHWGTGKYVNTRYENEGNPASQAVVTYEPLATGTGDVFTRTFYDGLGRPWRVQTPGETASGQRRITDTSYDARGNVWQAAFARFADETAQWTVNSYDWQDRVVKTVNPDASQRTYTYLVQPTAITGTSNLPVMDIRMTDEESKLRRTLTDKDNNVILASSQLAGTWVNEYRSYDVVGRLRGVRDDGGATWTYTYDLLGNRLTASDPDLGDWSYTYDNANRLVSQTDARGAVTTLAYDQMGRLLTKQVKAAGETTATVTAANTYDTADAGVGSPPFHNVGLLTKSVNGAATRSFSRSLSGSTTVLTTTTVIDGVTHTVVETRGRSEQTLSIAYMPAA